MTARADRGIGEACTPRHHKFPRGAKPGDRCHCGTHARCNQCWVPRPLADFEGRAKNCCHCAGKWGARRRGEKIVTPRAGLPTSGVARYTWVARSGNAKLGPIPTVLASAESCPPSCSWYGNGCFAEFDVLSHHWRNTQPGKRGITFDELLERVRALPAGQVWRYATAGDLPGVGDDTDIGELSALVVANHGRRGFTFTHRRDVPGHIEAANDLGFTINLSADTLEQADELAALGIAPVAVVLPSDLSELASAGSQPHKLAGSDIRTPQGRRIVLCPYETKGITCSVCQLCTRADRKGIVGFTAHGQGKRMVSEIASGKRRLPVLERTG